MSIELVEVQNKKQHKVFINLPWTIYEGDTQWVPPLKMSVNDLFNPKHPFYKKSTVKRWIAYKAGQPLGRIAAIINKAHNEFHEEKTGHFGFFECVEDYEVASALIDKAEKFLRLEGMEKIVGPVSPSTNYECGVLIKGPKDPPQIMMTYNHDYYPSLLENAGLSKSKDLLAYELSPKTPIPEPLRKASEKMADKANITCRSINKSNWSKEIDTMLEIYNDAWEKNWGFVPMCEEEFRHTANDMKSICDPNLIIFAEVNGDPAGFLAAIPDYNQVFKKIPNGKLFPTGIVKLLRSKKYITRARIITLGIKKKYQKLGLGAYLIGQIKDRFEKMPRYEMVEQSWVLEDNEAMNRPIQLLGASPYKVYRVYEKNL